MAKPVVEVAVCILRAADGRVLMAERTAAQLSAGFWELPGGKIDAGESPQQAAVRELAEEIGVEALQLRPWIRYEHEFRTRRIRLFFFRVERWTGAPRGREGQRIAWVDPAAPAVAPILPSVERVLLALGLASLLAVTANRGHGGAERRLADLQAALRLGLRCVLVREEQLAPDQRVAFARRVGALAQPFGARVLLTGTALEARRAGLSALHSSVAEMRRLDSRPQVQFWLSSCHDARDLHRAAGLGADAALVSPVLADPSHHGPPPLGWAGLQELAAGAPIPVIAEGGLTRAALPRALDAGAAGIAIADWQYSA